jgi:hypothetical protein
MSRSDWDKEIFEWFGSIILLVAVAIGLPMLFVHLDDVSHDSVQVARVEACSHAAPADIQACLAQFTPSVQQSQENTALNNCWSIANDDSDYAACVAQVKHSFQSP